MKTEPFGSAIRFHALPVRSSGAVLVLVDSMTMDGVQKSIVGEVGDAGFANYLVQRANRVLALDSWGRIARDLRFVEDGEEIPCSGSRTVIYRSEEPFASAEPFAVLVGRPSIKRTVTALEACSIFDAMIRQGRERSARMFFEAGRGCVTAESPWVNYALSSVRHRQPAEARGAGREIRRRVRAFQTPGLFQPKARARRECREVV